MAEQMPYVPGVPGAGSFGKGVPSFTTSPASYPMYYNGDFKATRTYNAVFNDYAEFFNSHTELQPKDLFIDNNQVIGIVSDTYGRITGEGNTPICLTGRVPLKTTIECDSGDYIYYNCGEIDIVSNWNKDTLSNKIGKVLYRINESEIMVLV